MRFTLAVILACLACNCLVAQQPSEPPSSFAVATIKPSAPEAKTLLQIRGNRFATEGATFLDVFKYAYNIQPGQLEGGPAWLRTARFDILADPETDHRPTSDQMKKLVQSLLADRFHLAMHIAQRLLPAYVLTRTTVTPRLTRSAADPQGIPVVGFDPKGELRVGNATMDDFARFLQRFVLDRPAVNQTQIPGRYDLVLRWTPGDDATTLDSNEPRTASDDRPALFTAIKEQLGLKLEATRANIDVYVVDHVETPTNN
jgi:uncharacterized protein (TIGR03435 family)